MCVSFDTQGPRYVSQAQWDSWWQTAFGIRGLLFQISSLVNFFLIWDLDNGFWKATSGLKRTLPSPMAQLVEHLTWKLEIMGSIPGLVHLIITNCLLNFNHNIIFAICRLLFNASESLVFPKTSVRNHSYFNLLKDFQKRKLFNFYFFPPLAVSHVGRTYYPKTPIDTPGSPLTPQDGLYMVRKSFNLFYMINYHEVIPFLVYITVSNSRRCKFYNLNWTYIVNVPTVHCHNSFPQ